MPEEAGSWSPTTPTAPTCVHGPVSWSRLGSDFRIVGEFADLTGQAVVEVRTTASIAFEIQFTDAGLVLVEDRSAEDRRRGHAPTASSGGR